MRTIARGIFNNALVPSNIEIRSYWGRTCDHFEGAHAAYPVGASFSILADDRRLVLGVVDPHLRRELGHARRTRDEAFRMLKKGGIHHAMALRDDGGCVSAVNMGGGEPRYGGGIGTAHAAHTRFSSGTRDRVPCRKDSGRLDDPRNGAYIRPLDRARYYKRASHPTNRPPCRRARLDG